MGRAFSGATEEDSVPVDSEIKKKIKPNTFTNKYSHILLYSEALVSKKTARPSFKEYHTTSDIYKLAF